MEIAKYLNDWIATPRAQARRRGKFKMAGVIIRSRRDPRQCNGQIGNGQTASLKGE